jgi:arylsulfatase A-like enzyme
MFSFRSAALAATSALGLAASPALAADQPHNLILFVADGLRSRIVTAETAPALAQVRAEGVDFTNSHSLFPTVTTPNASAIATGHRLGDTGDFGNTIFVGKPFPPPFVSPMAGLEDDDVLGLMNARFAGNYLNETSLLQAARAKGFSTAVLGKLGPAGVQDVTARDGKGTIVIDDLAGWSKDAGGLPTDPEILAAIKAAGLAKAAPDRGLNSWGGAYNMAGVQVANVDQQDWFVGVATRVLLPRFKAAGKPFVLVFWSRDPDGTQHNQGDSLNTLTPGINGPTSMAAIGNASNDLAALRAALKAEGLEATTDVVVTADHGFSTMTRESATSASRKFRYADVVPGYVPPGFMAIDLAEGLGLKLADGAGLPVDPKKGFYPKRGALLGADPARPEVVVAPNGGANLIYLPTGSQADRRAMAQRVVSFLTTQDYVGAIFVKDGLGAVPGALPTSAVGLAGSALTPAPDIVVSFKSFGSGCPDPEICGVEFADTEQQQGQGIHGAFGRQDTHNFMAAIGPDFKAGFVDPAPVSNADLAVTLAQVLGLDLGGKGSAMGRVLGEALRADGAARETVVRSIRSEPAANGFFTQLDMQSVGETPYFDAAGMPGRTIGLRP